MPLMLVTALGMAVAQDRAPCAPLDSSNPCLLECPGSPIYRFDLSSFMSPKNGPQWITISNYYVLPCMQPLRAVTCMSAMSTSAAVQYWGPGSAADQHGHFTNDCAKLGAFPPDYNNCTLMDTPGGGQPSLRCGFINGDPVSSTADGSAMRSVDIIYNCGKTANPAAVDQTPHYQISFQGKGACGEVWTKPLSLGWILIITFFVALLVYIVSGCVYNVKVGKQKVAVAALPQYRYWKQLPGLVKDGCKYSWTSAKKAYYHQVHGKAPPLDQSLTRRLAEGGDADDRT